ncbi:hypothetical protein [Phycicoccus sp. Soil803]|uniref:hypothetical protein n=1 Tax=Phycicoccus sp. Soil803 TaxID=1736415 RepID=UPI0012F91DED|nr:hypothetical protein [Phycicoccus sp. Soil803]
MGLESMITSHRLFPTRTLASHGSLRLHGPGVQGHSADLAGTGAIAVAWQRAVDSVGASLEGVKSLRGRIPLDIARRCSLALSAMPGPGSLVLSVMPKSDHLPEVEPRGDVPMFEPPRPLADRASETLIQLCSVVGKATPEDADVAAQQLRALGPRVASALRALATAVSTSNVAFDTTWEEPNAPTARSSWSVQQAVWVRTFVDGRDLDAEEEELFGVARTVSDSERWLVEVDGEPVRVDATDLPHSQVRRVRPGDAVAMLVRLAQREQPDGSVRTTRSVVELLDVEAENADATDGARETDAASQPNVEDDWHPDVPYDDV